MPNRSVSGELLIDPLFEHGKQIHEVAVHRRFAWGKRHSCIEIFAVRYGAVLDELARVSPSIHADNGCESDLSAAHSRCTANSGMWILEQGPKDLECERKR